MPNDKGKYCCEHKRKRYDCKECNSKRFCKHDRRFLECSRCCPEGAYKSVKRSAKKSTKKRRLPFELTLAEYKWVVSWPCSYCGEAFEPMTCDRIDSSKGYRFDNVQPLCHQCNMLKKDLRDEVFLNEIGSLQRHIEKITRHQAILKQQSVAA